MYYSLFVFNFFYKIIDLSFLNLANRRLTRLGLKRVDWAGPGLNINGLGPNSSLWAWARLGLTHFCGPGF